MEGATLHQEEEEPVAPGLGALVADPGTMLSRFRQAFSKFYGALLVSTFRSVFTRRFASGAGTASPLGTRASKSSVTFVTFPPPSLNI